MKLFPKTIEWKGRLSFIAIYLVGASFFAHNFLTRTIPAVGWDRILENWVSYLLLILLGHCFFALFWLMMELGFAVGNVIGENERACRKSWRD